MSDPGAQNVHARTLPDVNAQARTGAAPEAPPDVDVLIVGAGPTGLALAIQLERFGASFRIVDRLTDRGRESRALAIQARTLELLQSVGLGERLASEGQTSTRLALHLENRVVEASLGGFRAPDTRFPFILFLSQTVTEQVLGDHLATRGVGVDQGVELVELESNPHHVDCELRTADGGKHRVRARYLVGCDGAHSTVRRAAGIPFEGGTYLQDFALGDVDAEGALEPDAVNAFPGQGGLAICFPLGSPRPWRVIAMGPAGGLSASEESMTSPLSLPELQHVIDAATGHSVRLRDPAWLTHFRLHHRQAERYRQGRIFLAGDAAHIHSPVGGQGMNTGIQDAWNLGWKLALVAKGTAREALLGTYETERLPVGRVLLRTTDRIFGVLTRAVSATGGAELVRRWVVSGILPRIFGSKRLREYAFGFISQLRIRYRHSAAVEEGEPALLSGPRAGDRLPDVCLTCDGNTTYLQQELSGPHFHLLLCGEADDWDPHPISELDRKHGDMVRTRLLCLLAAPPGALLDENGEAFTRLGVEGEAQYLVRPDGYIAFRCAGHDLTGVLRYLGDWFSSRSN